MYDAEYISRGLAQNPTLYYNAKFITVLITLSKKEPCLQRVKNTLVTVVLDLKYTVPVLIDCLKEWVVELGICGPFSAATLIHHLVHVRRYEYVLNQPL